MKLAQLERKHDEKLISALKLSWNTWSSLKFEAFLAMANFIDFLAASSKKHNHVSIKSNKQKARKIMQIISRTRPRT